MIKSDVVRQLALSFPGATEQPHFEKTSFRVGKKIFATLDTSTHQACVKLSGIDQDVFSQFDKSVIFPVPGKWGLAGWTFIKLQKVPKKMFVDALTTAYYQVAPKKLSSLLKNR